MSQDYLIDQVFTASVASAYLMAVDTPQPSLVFFFKFAKLYKKNSEQKAALSFPNYQIFISSFQ